MIGRSAEACEFPSRPHVSPAWCSGGQGDGPELVPSDAALFLNLEVESGLGPEFVYSRDVVDAYEEPVELTALERDGRVPEWQGRIDAIRRVPFRG